jgi:glycosyltransferase involved in cell wall biosynthesis
MEKHRFRAPVLWCCAPDQVGLVERLPCRGPVYDCDREWGEEYVDQESDLVCRAEVVFAASPGLVARLSPCSDNIALLPNGVNHLMFQRDEFPLPPLLAKLGQGPILGRVGDVTSQVDLAPMVHAARVRPDWTFVLMGRVTKPAAQQLDGLPNVVLAGPVNAVELPDWLAGCHLLFDLLRGDRRGCDIVPAHVYEYLASGKPVVLMAEPQQTEPFPALVYTAYDATGFLRRCRRALEEKPGELSQLRQALARQSAWAERAAEVSRILEATGLF